MTGEAQLEIKTAREWVTNLTTGERYYAVRLSYRVKSTRRWTRILLIPDGSETLADMEAHAYDAARAHLKLVASRV